MFFFPVDPTWVNQQKTQTFFNPLHYFAPLLSHSWKHLSGCLISLFPPGIQLGGTSPSHIILTPYSLLFISPLTPLNPTLFLQVIVYPSSPTLHFSCLFIPLLVVLACCPTTPMLVHRRLALCHLALPFSEMFYAE